MALNGSGTYSPPSPAYPAVAGAVIYASDFNSIISDIAATLSLGIYRDGQAAYTANQSHAGYKITNLGNGASSGDAVNFGQVFTSPSFSGGVTISSGGLTVSAGVLSAAGGITASAGAVSLSAASSVTVPTVSGADSTTKAASTAWVSSLFAPLASPTFTGTVTIPSGASISGYAPLASPTFTGTPAAPTAAVGTNSTQIATMAALVNQAFLTALPNQSGNSGKYVTTDGTNASWVALSPDTVQLTATGSISAGAPVIIRSDGTIEAVSLTGATVIGSVGTAVSPQSVAMSTPATICYDSTNRKVILVYQDSTNSLLKAVVGTVAANTISWGTTVTVYAGAANYPACAYDSTNGKVVVCYKNNVSTYGAAVVGTVSGTSISFGSPTTFGTHTSNYIAATFNSGNGKVIIAYNDSDNTAFKSVVGTVSGTSISFGSTATILANNCNAVSICATGSSTVAVVFQDGSAARTKSAVGTVSGTSISFGALTTIDTDGTSYTACAYDTTNSKVVALWRDGGDTYGKAVVGTISGTSISFGSSATFESADTAYIAACYDSGSSKVVVVYRDAGNSNYGTVNVGTVSGTSISFGGASVWASLDALYIGCCYDSVQGRVVVGYRADGTTYPYGIVMQAGIPNLTASNFLGLSTAAYTNGQTATVTVLGGANAVVSGLTAATKYYVTDWGSLTTADTGYYAGVALSATKILLKG